jgi:hypothetical protein
MPVSYSFDGRIIIVKMDGLYSTRDLKKTILNALDDSQIPANSVLMFDLRESRALQERSGEDIRDMAKFLAANGERFGNRLGMVAPSDLAYGLMRMGAVTAETGGVTSMVFREFEQAKYWLLNTEEQSSGNASAD